jgi:IS5 family transposase
LLLATWHDLSDVTLAEALDERASFRRFCGFAAHEPTPERTAFVRFRRALVRRGLDRVRFDAVTRQLEAKGVMVRTGTLVDATLIPSASIRRDGGPTHASDRWAGHRRRKPTHGYKAHVATDQATVLIRGVEVIPIPIDQNPCAHSRSPMDMMHHGWSTSLFQAWQQ